MCVKWTVFDVEANGTNSEHTNLKHLRQGAAEKCNSMDISLPEMSSNPTK